MNGEFTIQRVEVRFVGNAPVKQLERAAGVSGVALEQGILRCLVCGSFQPFLEAIQGHEVISLTSTVETSEEEYRW